MNDAQKFIEWLAGHPCTERELWMVQNMLGTVYGFDSPVAQEAGQAWKRKRIEDLRAIYLKQAILSYDADMAGAARQGGKAASEIPGQEFPAPNASGPSCVKCGANPGADGR